MNPLKVALDKVFSEILSKWTILMSYFDWPSCHDSYIHGWYRCACGSCWPSAVHLLQEMPRRGGMAAKRVRSLSEGLPHRFLLVKRCVNIGGCSGYVDDAEYPDVAKHAEWRQQSCDNQYCFVNCHYADLCVPVPQSGIQADVISFNTALGALEVIQTCLNVVHVCSDRKVDSFYESLWCW